MQMWAINYRQKPTFFLHPDVHGIVSEDHAARIAAGILELDSSEGVIAVKVDIDD